VSKRRYIIKFPSNSRNKHKNFGQGLRGGGGGEGGGEELGGGRGGGGVRIKSIKFGRPFLTIHL
jgi:hypothetical protein